MKRRTTLAALLALALLAACKQSEELPPDAGVLRAIHAIPELDALTFTFDGLLLGDFNYSQIRGINRPGEGRHDVLIDVKPVRTGDPADRLETLDIRTDLNVEKTLMLTGTFAQHDLLTWEQPARDWATELAGSSAGITVLEVSFAHGAPSYGALDFYLGPVDFDPAVATPRATLAYGELEPRVEIDADNYELVVTPAGDPTTELFHTGTVPLPAAISVMFVAFDSDKTDAGMPRLRARSLGPGFSGVLADQNAPATLRAVHAARGTPTFDVREGTDDEILIPAVAFATSSPYVETGLGALSFSITSVAEPDASLLTVPVAQVADTDTTIVVEGATDALVSSTFADDHRGVVDHARFRVIQSAAGIDAIDAYLVAPGASIENETPVVLTLFYRNATAYLGVEPGDYDLVLTDNGDKTLVSDRLRVSLQELGVYTVLVFDAAEDGKAEVLPLDDLAPQ